MKKPIVFILLLFPYVTEVFSQSCTCSNMGNELVTNGDFSQGNVGFSTVYTFATSAWPENYGITTNANLANPGSWDQCTDHTTGSGNLLWADASMASLGLPIWTTTFPVNQNTNYVFSYWYENVNPNSYDPPGTVQLSVNSILQGIALTAPLTSCQWVQNCITWNSGSATSATISIINQSSFFNGNDFGFDDISFRECMNSNPCLLVASINPPLSICQGQSSSLLASGGTTYFWFPSTGLSNTNIANPIASPSTTTTYTVIVSDGICADTAFTTVNVNPLPNANFSSNVVCQGSSTNFTDLSNPGSGSIVNWNWNFGDASSASSQSNPIHLYANDSTYNVTLIVTNQDGCSDTINLPVSIASTPIVNFTADTLDGCPTLCVNFQDQSSVANGNIIGWNWNFGDGSNSSIQQNPSHCFSIPGSYTITLSTITSGGCTNTLVIPNMITVHPVPQANFSANPTVASILNPTIAFTDESQGNPIAWSWNFGDPTTTSDVDNNQNTAYTYSSEYGATYSVNLIVTNQFGCVDDTTINVIIQPDFAFFIPNAFTPNNDGINDGFFGTGYGITKYEINIFDRWGNLIFKSDDINQSWDGTVQGKGGDIAQIDVYVWKVNLSDVFDQKHNFIGHVSLLK